MGKHITTASLQVKYDGLLLSPALSAQRLHLPDGRNDRYDAEFDDDLAYGEFYQFRDEDMPVGIVNGLFQYVSTRLRVSTIPTVGHR